MIKSTERFNSTKGYLFPYFVCRVAGLPVRYMADLRAYKTIEMFNSLYRIEKKLNSKKKGITESIYKEIGVITEKNHRNILLKLKRDIHNLRFLSQERLLSSLELLPILLSNELATFQQMMEERRSISSKLEKVHTEEILTIRRKFQSFIADADFQKGLLLSSQSLFSSLDRYTSLNGVELGGKEKQIERGLMRYFSRMAMKTTPFSSFCAIIPGEFSNELKNKKIVKSVFEIFGNPRKKKSFMRINKSFYRILLEHFKAHPGVKNNLNIELNPTIYNEKTKLVFLSTVNGRETFQRLQKNAVLDLIMDILNRQTHLPLKQVVEILCANEKVDANREEVEPFIDKLLEIGLIRFRTGIREQEVDWDILFEKQLASIDDDHAKEASSLLKQLRATIEAYSHASVKERKTLLEYTSSLIDSSFKAMEIPNKLKMNTPFYEDSTADSRIKLSLDSVRPATEQLFEFMNLTFPLAWPRLEQATMRHFFDTYYNNGVKFVPLLQFYEDYYREHFKAHLEKQAKAQAGLHKEELKEYNLSNPFNLDIIRQIEMSHKNLTNLIRTRWSEAPEAEEINIETKDIQAALKNVEPVSSTCRSVSMFVQLVPGLREGETPTLIIQKGSYLTGYGKFFSRFLYMFPDSVQNELYEKNNELAKQYLAEICGDGDFNANLHPPLLHWEISYPTGESGITEEQIRSSDLYIEADFDDQHALSLRHLPTGKRVMPVDLGFLNPRMRPPLYQLLSRFTPPANFALQIPESLNLELTNPSNIGNGHKLSSNSNQDKSKTRLQVLYRPRVTYNRILILSRRRWQVPAELFPNFLLNESSCNYFVRLNRWRKNHGIPSEVFIRIKPLRQPIQKKGKDDKVQKESQKERSKNQKQEKLKFRGHLYKPQYIDFSNPLLVDLFGRTATTLKNFVVNIEECLPTAEDLPQYQNDLYVTELILQFNFCEGKKILPHDTHSRKQ